MAHRILVVDDDQQIVRLVRSYLEQAGMTVLMAYDGETAMHTIKKERPDLIILDIMLPGHNGFSITRWLRADSHLADIPILMLTAKVEDTDKISGLELGADDYLTKPFSPKTLLARVKALLRRASADRSHAPLSAGRVTLDIENYNVRIGGGQPISLTKLELRLLQMLLAQAGRTVNSDRLLVQVWGHRGSGDRQLLKQLVHRLRHKIEANPAVPQLLQTAAPAGYKLVVD